MNDFDRIVGLKYLKGMHINDSKVPLNSRKDRHENLGLGTIPMACFHAIMNDDRMNDIPLILETPVVDGKDETMDAVEVRLLYGLIEGEDAVDVKSHPFVPMPPVVKVAKEKKPSKKKLAAAAAAAADDDDVVVIDSQELADVKNEAMEAELVEAVAEVKQTKAKRQRKKKPADDE